MAVPGNGRYGMAAEASAVHPDQDNAAIRSSARVTIATFWIA